MNLEIKENSLDNAPLPEEKLLDLINFTYGEIQNDNSVFITDDLIQKILEMLNKHSSLYKYIVSVTTVNNVSDQNDLKISNTFGASWSPKKDGQFSCGIKDENDSSIQYLVSIIWISK